MENSDSKFTLSRNLGLFTGPAFILLGLFVYFREGSIKQIGVFIVAMGIVRIGLTAYTFWLRKKEQNKIE